jgi:1-acyl-sn-glycerol-3-phosphate acyltransferase
VPDAEVIPLGTRGRPGRGTGSAKPSSAARGLASAGKPRSRADRKTDPSPEQPPSEPRPVPSNEAEAAQPARPDGGATPDASDPGGAPTDGPAADRVGGRTVPDESRAAARRRQPVTTSEPTPEGGIPVGDWLAAFRQAAVEVFGDAWEPRLAEFLAFLRRRVTGDYSVDEYGFDREVTERFFLSAVRPIKEKWFRVEVRGIENIPTDGGALVVSNHSGTVPVDGLMTMVSVHDHTGRHLRPLGADLVFRLPVVGELARKGGATLACNEDAQRMLGEGELVGVWPEGFKGIGKPYSERYKLQRFGRGGFVSAAVRTGVPIIPCSVVGAEEIYPLVGNMPALARLLGVPYIPITPFFPLLGPLGLVPLPSKWLIEFGEPIRTDSYDEGAADDPMLVFNVTDQVRETIQQTLYGLLMQRRSVFH